MGRIADFLHKLDSSRLDDDKLGKRDRERVKKDLRKMKDKLDGMSEKDKAKAQRELKTLEERIEKSLKKVEIVPIKALTAFKKIHAIITLDIGGIPFAMTHKHIKVHKEKFEWKDRSFPTDTTRIAYVDGSEPVVIYDYNAARPRVFSKAEGKEMSSATFNRLFKRNWLEQALAALEKSGFQVNGILMLILGLAVGYVLAGIVGAPPIFGHGGTTTPPINSTTTTGTVKIP